MADDGQRISENTITTGNNISDGGANGTSSSGQWLSISALAARRRISEASAARLIRRRKWQKRTDADGRISVFVPDRDTDTPNKPRGSQPAIEVLRMAVEALSERLRMADADILRLRTERDQARAEAVAGQGRAAELERAIEAARQRGLLARLLWALRGG